MFDAGISTRGMSGVDGVANARQHVGDGVSHWHCESCLLAQFLLFMSSLTGSVH